MSGLRPARPGRVQALCVGIAAAGVSTLAVVVVSAPHAPAPSLLLVICFAVLLAAEVFPLHLTHEGDSEALHIEEALLVPMILLLPAVETVVVVAASVLVSSVTSGRGVLKGAFNTGLMTSAAGLAILLAHLLGASGTVDGGDLAAAAVGALAFCLTSALVVSWVISLAQGSSFRRVFTAGLGVRALTWLGSLALGVLLAMAASARPAALVVAVVPAVALQFATSRALEQWRERQQVDALYRATIRIHATVEPDVVRAELLAAARLLLSAGHAQLVPPAVAPAAGGLRAPLDDVAVVEVTGRAMGGAWTPSDANRLKALAGVAAGALSNARLFEQMEAVTASLGEGVVAVDAEGVVTFANPAAEQLLGWCQSDLVGRAITATLDPDGRSLSGAGQPEWVHLPRLRAGETMRMDEHQVSRRDGTSVPVALTASPVVRAGQVVGAVIVLRDVRDRKALEERLLHQAFHDDLTGLPNRSVFLDRLEHARTRGASDGSTQAVLFIDVDRFKLINDSLGHRVGDEVLRAVAYRLAGVLSTADTVARFGGDEFTVLLENLPGPGAAARTAEAVLRALQPSMRAGGRDVSVTVSVGIAIAEPGNAPADLLAAADIAMYQAKSSGRNRYVVATADADEQARARLDLEVELRRAVQQGQLEVHYQPVLHAGSGALYGLEALVRWRHPRLGLLAPAHFMAVAEESGLVIEIGAWVLEQACAAGVDWERDHPGQPVVMAVNLSARQFQQSDLCEQVADVLRRTGLRPQLLALEITETVVMEDTATTLATLRALKQLKVRLSIDDFGTGYSSLSYLKRFPVDAVKIDKSFVDGLAGSPVDREIVRAVIRLAAAVGMQTIAEGVETTSQRQELEQLGCTMLQGYLLSRPVPIDQVDRSLGLRVPAARAALDEQVSGVTPLRW